MNEKRIEFSLVEQNDIDSTPIEIENGIDDQSVKSLSLGSLSVFQKCDTCGLTDKCPGHVGKIFIEVPLFKIQFKKLLEPILKIICPQCQQIKSEEVVNILKKIENHSITPEIKKQFNNLLQNLKLTNKQNETKCCQQNCKESSSAIQFKNSGFVCNINKVRSDVDNKVVFAAINAFDKNLLILLTNSNARSVINPKNIFFNTYMSVPSNIMRQPNFNDSISNPDKLTTSLNELCKSVKKDGTNERKIQEKLDSVIIGKNKKTYDSVKQQTLAKRINGTDKESDLRKNLNGKRVDRTARSVINGNKSLKIGYINTPNEIIKKLTSSIYVNNMNKNYCQSLINNDNNFNANKKQVKEILRKRENSINPYKVYNISIANNGNKSIKYGDIIEVNLTEGMFLTYNRPPSIHKWNIQAMEISENKTGYEAIDGIDRTSNIALPSAPSYNADFDGDEMMTKLANNKASNIEQGCILNSRALLKHDDTGTVMFGLLQEQIVASNMLLQEKNISLNMVYNILGEYAFIVNSEKEKKNVYTGREVLSMLFPSYLSDENVFSNGNIIINKFSSNMLSANSYNSIFNILTQVYDNSDYAINMIDTFKTVVQNYIFYYGFSIKFRDVVPQTKMLKEIKNSVYEYVKNVNQKINEMVNDIKNRKYFINSYDEITYIKEQNISVIMSKLRNLMEENLKKYYTQDDNIFKQCYEVGYKTNLDTMTKLLACVGQKKKKDLPVPGINGKTSLYSISNDLSIENSGFITSSIIEGLTYNEMVNAVKHEDLPTIVDVNTVTAELGAFGKKLIRICSELYINYDKFLVSTNHIISFNPNGLKVSGADLCKINIFTPNNEFIWKEEIESTYNELKPYMIQKNMGQYNQIKQVDFYINIYSEIVTYYEENKNNKSLITYKNYDKIKRFYLYILEKFYFDLAELEYVYYILLTYFDPSAYIFKQYAKNISQYMTDEMLDKIFYKIEFKLKYSLDPGYAFGYSIAHTIQEDATQNNLSLFQTLTKGGKSIQKGTKDELKQILDTNSNKREELAVFSSYKSDVLEEIKRQFEYISLNTLIISPIKIINKPNNNNEFIYKIQVSIDIMNQKNISVTTLYKMFSNYCNKCYCVTEYNIFFDIEEDKNILNVLLATVLNTKMKLSEEKYSINLIKSSFLLSLFDGVHKGKEINSNLFINSNTLNGKKIYELKLFLKTPNELSVIDTSQIEDMELPPYFYYETGGIQYFKNAIIGKALTLFNNTGFHNSIKHMFDFRYINKNPPKNIKVLNNKNEIVKAANHGNSNSFANAAFNNLTDKCNDLYSSLVVAKIPNYGTNYYTFGINLNKLDIFKKYDKNKINYNQTIELAL